MYHDLIVHVTAAAHAVFGVPTFEHTHAQEITRTRHSNEVDVLEANSTLAQCIR